MDIKNTERGTAFSLLFPSWVSSQFQVLTPFSSGPKPSSTSGGSSFAATGTSATSAVSSGFACFGSGIFEGFSFSLVSFTFSITVTTAGGSLSFSRVVIDEIEKCPEPKQGMMLEKLRQVNFQFLPETDEVITLADEYVNGGVLNQKNIADCRHIAHAVVNHCDVIVSWNFAHLASFKTINKVIVVNAMVQYREINIMPPTMFLK